LLKDQFSRDEAAGRQEDAITALGKAIEWTPLDWWLYVQRAQVEGGRRELTAALGDFRRARFLEPNYAGLPFQEGRYWLGVMPAFAIEAWEEALRRTPSEQRPDLYQNMLAAAFPDHPQLHWPLWSLAGSDHAMQMVYFGWATPAEFKEQMDEILHDEPALRHFDAGELRRLFPIWMEKGDARQLAYLLARRPAWLVAGYRTLARYDASTGDYPEAVDLMERYLPPPRIPQPPAMTQAEAASRFQEDHGDIAAGLALYTDAAAAGREAEALATLEAMAGNPGCPGYVHYLQAQLLVKEEKLPEAWKALDQCP
jgi:tetratricopeptide (TPR) repeat protein